VSGPLVDWVLAHSKASRNGKLILVSFAAAARHNGTPARVLEPAQHMNRTGMRGGQYYRALREVVERGELERSRPDGGRHVLTRYRVPFTLCPTGADCWECDQLRQTLPPAGEKPPRNSPPTARNSPPGGRHSRTDGSPLQGEPSPPGGGSDARSSAPPRKRGSAARSGSTIDPATARRELVMGLGAGSQAEAERILRLPDREVIALWHQRGDAPSA
jgi:hypothetical protein